MTALLPVLKQPGFVLRPCTTKDFCLLYGVSDKTFLKWIIPFREEIGERHGAKYTVLQVHIIVSRLGVPGLVIGE